MFGGPWAGQRGAVACSQAPAWARLAQKLGCATGLDIVAGHLLEMCPHLAARVTLTTCPFTGTQLHLDSLRIRHSAQLASGPQFRGNVQVHPAAKIGEDCVIGPDVSISAGCVIEDGVRLSNCVVMTGVRVKKHTKVRQRH